MENNPSNATGVGKLILEYPDYDANRESDFNEGRPETNLAVLRNEDWTLQRDREHTFFL